MGLPERREPFRPLMLEGLLPGRSITFNRGPVPGDLAGGLASGIIPNQISVDSNLSGGIFPIEPLGPWFGPDLSAVQEDLPGLLCPEKLLSFGEESLPAYRLLQNRRCDLDGDGVAERYTLQDGIVTVQAGSRLIWQSPGDWWVDYFFLGDIDNNGMPELNLSVWKEGSFGPQRPFWMEEDPPGIKNHLFIFKLAGGRCKPVWQSSNLDCPNYWSVLCDFNGDGENELLAIEGCYSDPRKREVILWQWNGWGFTRVD